MVRMRKVARWLPAGWLLAMTLGSPPARAEGEAPPAASAVIGSGAGSGQRHVTPSEPGGEAETGAAPRRVEPGSEGGDAKPAKPPVAKPPTHRRGRPPKQPRPTLPEGVPPPSPSEGARRGVAQGPLASKTVGPDDPELVALRQAELVLFPRPLEGLTPGWSWELPSPLASGGPAVSADGFPPALPGPAAGGERELPAAEAEWLATLTLPNLPVRFDPRVVKYLRFYRDDPQGRVIARIWAKKSGRYGPALRAELAKAGMPTDLMWLSLIESGHNPTIHSPAGAAGLWQFIPESARMYGLIVDRWVDERLDPRRSTQAALLYLSDLYQRFGSWELAMGAYNMGHGGMSRAITRYNTNDFWELSRHEAGVPWETTLYVPKILAIAVVMTNKSAFGLDQILPDEPVEFDTVRVSPGLSLSRVAAAAELSLAVVEAHNPHLLSGRVPPATGPQERWLLALPRGTGERAARRLARAEANDGEPYVVRFGDTVEAIALETGATAAKLRSLNRLATDELLEVGTVLLVPKTASPRAAGSLPAEVVVVPAGEFRYPDRRRVFYRVRRGDGLEPIAAAFGVQVGELALWNALDLGARLQPGMSLQLFVPRRRSLDGVRCIPAESARILVAGTPEFIDHFEGEKGKRRLVIAAREGDTLASVGARYGMSVGWMERVNRRSRRDPLAVGESLVVYAPRPAGAPLTGARAESDPLEDRATLGETSLAESASAR